jgi:acyl dehydratase
MSMGSKIDRDAKVSSRWDRKMQGMQTRLLDSVAARWAAAGTLYQPMTVVRDAAYQARRLRAADIDPALFGERCEPGLFGLDCFSAMVAAGHDIDGYVFIGQTCRQIRPVRLGETVTLSGHVRECRPVRGGICVVDVFRLSDSNGLVCWESELTGLLVDEVARRASENIDVRVVKREAVSGEAWQRTQDKTLTPQKVRDFSEDVGNLIHFDEAYAQQHGFRAPLAQGVMSATWLLSALHRERLPSAFDVDIRFMRPVFWDSPASLWITTAPGGDGIVAAQSRDADGKVTADLAVRWLTGAAATGSAPR